MSTSENARRRPSRNWDPVADWYAGWSGPEGSEHHRAVAIPTVLEMLQPSTGDHVLDIGCGPGALAPHVARVGARYTGLDASVRLLARARRHHGSVARFVLGDATDPSILETLGVASYDAVVFLLSIQDIDPLPEAVQVAAGALRVGGRLVVLMTHPCFRIPRQSGWGWDAKRKLRFRRVDSYMSSLAVPMKPYGAERRGTTQSYHRPLERYSEALAESGLMISRIREVPYLHGRSAASARAERRAAREIPLFLGLGAVKR